MARRRVKLPPRQGLIARSLTDENFAHCLGLFPFMRAWAKHMKPGAVLSFNDVNMVTGPVECLEAFVREHAKGQGALAETCRDAVVMIERLEQIDAMAAEAATPLPLLAVGDTEDTANG